MQTLSNISPTHEPLNILVVDDDEVDVMTVRRELKKAQIPSSIRVTYDAETALETLRREHASADRWLVLLDINMPRMNGIELLSEIRSDPELYELPVIVLTTSDDERDWLAARRLRATDYLLKPLTLKGFERALDKMEPGWRRSSK